MHFSSDACPGNPLAAGLDVRIEIPNAPGRSHFKCFCLEVFW